jgi:hypothetical protein
MMLGTMGYMAPEQVRGLPADHRADIFAFGAILYEMLSGQRAFRGATAADTISAILDKDPPDLPMTERHIPPALARVVDRCLEKSPAARFQSTHDLAFALEGLSGHSESGVVAGPRPVSRPNRREQRRGARERARACDRRGRGRSAFGAPSTIRDDSLLHSFAGRRGDPWRPGGSAASRPTAGGLSSPRREPLAAHRVVGPVARLLDARVLPGTEHAGQPGAFWSPDGRAVAFFADGKLKKIDIAGGALQVLCDVGNIPMGGTWGRGGVIVFGMLTGGLWLVPAAGGQPTSATTLDAGRQEPAIGVQLFFRTAGDLLLAQPGIRSWVARFQSVTFSRPTRKRYWRVIWSLCDKYALRPAFRCRR